MALDLKAYADRIGLTADWQPTVSCLHAIHLAHATHIPFENLDVLLKRPILLDLESLWKKLVLDRRGGYCFEQNTLFAAVLEQIGFRVTRLGARVRLGATGMTARTHMALLVEAGGTKWLADVGFGGDGLLYPVPFLPGETVTHFAWKLRIVEEGDWYALQAAGAAGWVDEYAFNLEEQYPIDYVVANHYTSTHPNSRFVRKLTAQLPGKDSRLLLINDRLIEKRPDRITETVLSSDAEILKVLAGRFGLEFPAGTRFPYEEEVPAV